MAQGGGGGESELAVTVPAYTYLYRQMRHPRLQDFEYKLEAILPGQQTLSFFTDTIERSTLVGQDLSHLQLFNHICIPELNAATMRFLFASERDGAYTCAVTPTGQLSLTAYSRTAPAYDDASVQVPPEDETNPFHAISTFTVLHDYVQTKTPGRYFHVGMSVLPCGTHFLPVWVNASMMRGMLSQWYGQKLAVAKAEARIVLRLPNEGSSIRHVLPRPPAAATTMPPPPPLPPARG